MALGFGFVMRSLSCYILLWLCRLFWFSVTSLLAIFGFWSSFSVFRWKGKMSLTISGMKYEKDKFPFYKILLRRLFKEWWNCSAYRTATKSGSKESIRTKHYSLLGCYLVNEIETIWRGKFKKDNDFSSPFSLFFAFLIG